MSINEPKSEWIRLVATPTDKALLEALQQDNMDDSISATVRRLIRQEARRRNLVSVAAETNGHDAPVLAGRIEEEQ